MEAERLYTKQPSRTIQQKRGGEGALEMVDNRPAGYNYSKDELKTAQLKTHVYCRTKEFKYDKHNSETAGNKIMAYLDPTDPQQGSEPSTSALSKTKEAFDRNNYHSIIKGHLLNGLLGGPGIAQNLFPITPQANHLHLLYAENHIKRFLSTKHIYPTGVMYSVEVTDADYTIDSPSCAFTCEAYPWIVGPNADETEIDKSRPILYPIDIVSEPKPNSTGNGRISELKLGYDTYGNIYDYTGDYKSSQSSFTTSSIAAGWGSLGRGMGRNRDWSYIEKVL